MNKLVMIAAAAGALSLPGLADAADLSGAWKLVISVMDMTYHATCDLKQDGAMLSGTCIPADPPPDGGDAPKASAVSGAVDGSSVKFGYDITFGDMMLHLDYTGAATSDAAMTGTLEVAGTDGTFTGSKS